MTIVQEKTHLVHDRTKHNWQGDKIGAGQATLDWTHAGQLQQCCDASQKQIPSKLHQVHSSNDPCSFLQKSLQEQKHWMRQFLKKPKDMPMQDYIA